jgi:hypothetical protein
MKKVHFFSAVLVMLIFVGCKQGSMQYEDAADTTAVEAADSEMLLPNPDDALTTNENTESYAELIENPFESPKTAPLSTFSIDVDNAAYTNSDVSSTTANPFRKMRFAWRKWSTFSNTNTRNQQTNIRFPSIQNTARVRGMPSTNCCASVYRAKISQPTIYRRPIWCS